MPNWRSQIIRFQYQRAEQQQTGQSANAANCRNPPIHKELQSEQEPEKQARLAELAEKARKGTITLVFAARAWEISNAVVLRRLVAELAKNLPGEP